MKRNLFGKNIRFALILSTASLISIQAGEAVDVYCPTSKELKLNKPKQLADGTWQYSVKSTGLPFTFTANDAHKKEIQYWKLSFATVQVIPGHAALGCSYTVTYGTNDEDVIMLTSQDEGVEYCMVEKSRYFQCDSEAAVKKKSKH